MARSFKFPDLGEGVHEGEVLAVPVSVGQEVKEGDIILEVETDKAAVEIPSPYNGTVTEILVKPGDAVHVGVGLPVDVRNAPVVPDDGDVLGPLLPTGDVAGRGVLRGARGCYERKEKGELLHELDDPVKKKGRESIESRLPPILSGVPRVLPGSLADHLQGSDEEDLLEGAVQRRALEVLHGHLVHPFDQVTLGEHGLGSGEPYAGAVHLDLDVGVARGVHGLAHGALPARRRGRHGALGELSQEQDLFERAVQRAAGEVAHGHGAVQRDGVARRTGWGATSGGT